MFKLLNVIRVLFILLRWPHLLAYKYELEFHNSEIFLPCNDYPDNFLDKFLKNAENYTQLPDGNIYINGDVVLTYDFKPSVLYPFQVEFFKQERGEWHQTLYTVRRGNFCTDFFNPIEVWHKFVKDIPPKQRTCPLKKGKKFSLDFVTDTVFEFGAPDLAGEHRGRLTVGTNAPPDNMFLCTETLLLAYKYELEFQNSDVFSPCNDFPDKFLDKFLIMPDNYTLLPDGNIYVGGDLVLTYNFQSHVKYPLKAEIYKRERGEWQRTLYTVQRQDFCTAFFNPLEMWHTLVKKIPPEQRTCPLKKGQIISFDFVIEAIIELESPNLEGDYRSRVEMNTNDPNDFCCADVYFSLYRI